MVQIIAESYSGTNENPLPIGREGENGTRTVVFTSLPSIRQEYGDTSGLGSWKIFVKRPLDSAVYEAEDTWQSAEGYACWDVSLDDTKVYGNGYVELRYFPNPLEETLFKSILYVTKVEPALRIGGDPSEGTRDALDRLMLASSLTNYLTPHYTELRPISIIQNGSYIASDYKLAGWNEIYVSVPSSAPDLSSAFFSENGLYSASDYGVYGFDTVEVAVPPPEVISASFSSNGLYLASDFNAYGFSAVEVSVAGGVSPSGTKSITQNGIYDIISFASVDVNVSDIYKSIVTRTIKQFTDNEILGIGPYAFAECLSLSMVSASNCKTVFDFAFQDCHSLWHINIPNCEYIYAKAFTNCDRLEVINFNSPSLPECLEISKYAFESTHLYEIEAPKCTKIGEGAFSYCFYLSKASFPVCTSIGSLAFNDCNALTSVYFPVCEHIGSSAFYYCNSLTTVSFPACTDIGLDAFRQCALISISQGDFSVCETIGLNAFFYCALLTKVVFPVCKSIYTDAFAMCESLEEASFPACINIGSDVFGYCSILSSVSFPVCTSIGRSAFMACPSLTTVSFPSCTYIGSTAFMSCYSLLSLYLMASSVATLANSNAFSYTPIAGYTDSTAGQYGSIYVPASLYDSYKTAANWSFFSSRFVSV